MCDLLVAITPHMNFFKKIKLTKKRRVLLGLYVCVLALTDYLMLTLQGQDKKLI
jgi:hypothetical protein